MHFYLGPYRWNRDHAVWQPPAGAVAAVDLRTLDEQAVGGGSPRGVGLFASEEQLPAEFAALGSSLTGLMSSQAQSAWQRLLNVANVPATLGEALWDRLTVGADPQGREAAPPLMPNGRGRLVLQLAKHGGGTVLARRVAPRGTARERCAWQQVVAVHRRDFARLAQHESTAGGEAHRKLLGFWLTRKYAALRPAADWFQPPELRIAPLEPQTMLTESFNQADSETLGPEQSWTKTVGNLVVRSQRVEAQAAGASFRDSIARCDATLSSDDADVSIQFQAATGSSARVGVLGRMSPVAASSYAGFIEWNGFSETFRLRLYKQVNGVSTLLRSADLPSVSAGDAIKLTCDGSTISVEHVESATTLAVTDTAITGNLHAGIHCSQLGSPSLVQGDGWYATDELGVVPGAAPLLPGGAGLAATGPGRAVFGHAGPGKAALSRVGPGAAHVARRESS